MNQMIETTMAVNNYDIGGVAMKQILFILLTIIIFLVGCSTNSIRNTVNSKILTIHFIDVGQGDCDLIQINNKNLLIDAGPIASANKVVKYLREKNVRTIDYCIETHPHEDHIGGMDKLINKFNILHFYGPLVTTNTSTFIAMVRALKEKNLKISVAKGGEYINLGLNVTAEFIAPNSEKYTDMNNYSAVLKLTYKNVTFLFQGDAQSLSEKEILSSNYNIKADVIKIGHHGSKTSTTQNYLKVVNPKIAIISCGIGNDYGHPATTTIKKLKIAGCTIFGTYTYGTIILESDGNTVWKK